MFINFTFMWPCIATNFFVIKPTKYTNFTNLFCHEILHVSDSSSAHRQEFIHCTLSNGICHTTFEQGQGSCSTAVYKLVGHIPLLSVQWINSWWWADELSETCRASWQNKFVKLVHLVDFITKIFINVFKMFHVTGHNLDCCCVSVCRILILCICYQHYSKTNTCTTCDQ
jgi:hypothetical protein